ncbi:hypothetical protein VB776_16300 [Arcicella sp. DC2W]|uniref:Uncharacterized protein n=1 Tax=Arcicella gelida TaxID=2984195 RepID=A0ABU5S7Q8_9BACT|nr:hypothetical protein [Arcicella sp. DC2W]MEA5404495.1 hypothetical protein [Arcicella sp. DC2W]
MRTNGVNQNFTKELVSVVLEEMQLEQREIGVLKSTLMKGFFCYLKSDVSDYQDERIKVCNAYESINRLLDKLE